MRARSRAGKLVTSGTSWLWHSPGQHRVMFAQRWIVIIHHRNSAMITSVQPQVQRAETKRTFFDGDVGARQIPGDKRLAVTAIHPRTGQREIVAQNVFRAAFAANDHTAGARHREVRAMREAMNFDDVSEHSLVFRRCASLAITTDNQQSAAVECYALAAAACTARLA